MSLAMFIRLFGLPMPIRYSHICSPSASLLPMVCGETMPHIVAEIRRLIALIDQFSSFLLPQDDFLPLAGGPAIAVRFRRQAGSS
jgi:hypothetical protein